MAAAARSRERGRRRSALRSRLAPAGQAESGGARVSARRASPTDSAQTPAPAASCLGLEAGLAPVVLLAEGYCGGPGDFPGIAHREPVLVPNRAV